MNVPYLEESERLLKQAAEANPGSWVQPSRNAAKAAMLIVERVPDLNPDVSYVLGLLHDIGRWECKTHIRHLIDGYRYKSDLGYDNACRICLTHIFLIRNPDAFLGGGDCSEEALQFLKDYISTVEFGKYDRLVQLCDGISLPPWFCLIEKRMVDVALRLGINGTTLPA